MTPEELFEKISKNIFNWQVNKNEVIELIRKIKKEWCIEFAEFCTGIKREFIENGYEKFLNAPETE